MTSNNLIDTNLVLRNIKCNDLDELATSIRDFNNTTLRILSFNPRSIGNIDRFESFKELLAFLNVPFDLIVISESWIKQDLIDVYELENYNSIHSCRRNEGSGGVILYYHNSLEIAKSEIKHEHNFNMIQTVLQTPRKDTINVIACYRSPINSLAMLQPFYNELECMLQQTGTSRSILLGDINIDADNNTQQLQQYQNLLQSYSLTLCNTNFTREASKTRIDHVVSNFSEEAQHTIFTCPLQKDDIFYSDHSILATFINIESWKQDSLKENQFFKYVNHKKVEKELNEKFTYECIQQYTDPNSLSSYILDVVEQSQRNSTRREFIN